MVDLSKPTRGTAKAERRARTNKARTREREEKQKVRRRDRFCRFPLCSCHRKNYALHVSHQRHKGMGGNPKGDRSTSAEMVLVCAPRHRESALSIDSGTISWEGLTLHGADGPIRWLLHQTIRDGVPCDLELARESAVQTLLPLTAQQRALLMEFSLRLEGVAARFGRK